MPPQSVAIQLKISSPTGTASASANSIAKISKPDGIGAVYMFCIQASGPSTRDRQQRAAIAPRWLNRGLRANVGRTSEITPAANDQDQHVGAGEEEPGEVLVQKRGAALAGVEEDAVEVAVDEQHRQRGEHHRADDQQQVAADRRPPRTSRGMRRQAIPGARMLWSVTTRLIAKQTKPRIASAAPTIQASTPPASREDLLRERRQRRQARSRRGVHRKLA